MKANNKICLTIGPMRVFISFYLRPPLYEIFSRLSGTSIYLCLIIWFPCFLSVCPTALIYSIDKMEEQLRNCTVIEGHVAFTNMFQEKAANSTAAIPSFPELREITDFMLLYLGDQLKSLSTVFPNLSVIRGNKLIKVNFTFPFLSLDQPI